VPIAPNLASARKCPNVLKLPSALIVPSALIAQTLPQREPLANAKARRRPKIAARHANARRLPNVRRKIAHRPLKAALRLPKPVPKRSPRKPENLAKPRSPAFPRTTKRKTRRASNFSNAADSRAR